MNGKNFLLAIYFITIFFPACSGRPYFMYYPEKQIKVTPEHIGLKFENINFITKDNLILSGWWIPSGKERCIILYSHGNSGNLSHNIAFIQIFNKLDASVFIYDYRGYGESQGKPSEEGTYLDAEAAWLYLINERKTDSRKIVIFGRSLGGSISAWLAAKYKPAFLIIESSFSSLHDVANDRYSCFPGKLVFGESYSTSEYLKDVKCPVLVIHSRDDELSPFSQGEKIFKAAPEPKEFLIISGTHNRGSFLSLNKYSSGLDSFISKYIKHDLY